LWPQSAISNLQSKIKEVRVLIISDYRDTQSVRPEAELMIGLKNQGVDIRVITYPGTVYEKKFRETGIPVELNHPDRKYDRNFIKYLKETIVRDKIDILYLFNSKAIINGVIAAIGLPVKVVLYRGYTGHIHWYDPTAYFKYLHPRVDRVVCLADSVKDLLYNQKFFRKEKAVTINKGHDPAWYRDIAPLGLQEFGIPPDAFVVACMANARPFKGIRYLLKATWQMERMSALHLLLIGRDMSKGHLDRLIEESPMSRRIHVTGWRKDALNILASCQSFILPSIGGEATTKSVIEAMSMGLAPVITDIPGNKDLVIHQECGLVVPSKDPGALADAVFFYYTHPQLSQDHGRAAKVHIEKNFHIERTIRETKILFESLV
jgi:L-malate glycosyltransferase